MVSFGSAVPLITGVVVGTELLFAGTKITGVVGVVVLIVNEFVLEKTDIFPAESAAVTFTV